VRRVAITQSNYIPWKGYFDLIDCVDEFILYDDMQYTKRDWRNRNKISTPQGLKWLTIPVNVKGKFHQKINETTISDKSWSVEHFQTIKHFYSKSPFFSHYEELLAEFYLTNEEEFLSRVNFKLISLICQILDIDTRITFSSDYELSEGKSEKLIGICKQASADVYVSGPAAKTYFDEALAEKNNIKVEWKGYEGYPEYQQMHEPFEHGVSILDLIFNKGPEAKEFIKIKK